MLLEAYFDYLTHPHDIKLIPLEYLLFFFKKGRNVQNRPRQNHNPAYDYGYGSNPTTFLVLPLVFVSNSPNLPVRHMKNIIVMYLMSRGFVTLRKRALSKYTCIVHMCEHCHL